MGREKEVKWVGVEGREGQIIYSLGGEEMEIVEFGKYPLFLEGERIDGKGRRGDGAGNVGRENQQAGKK